MALLERFQQDVDSLKQKSLEAKALRHKDPERAMALIQEVRFRSKELQSRGIAIQTTVTSAIDENPDIPIHELQEKLSTLNLSKTELKILQEIHSELSKRRKAVVRVASYINKKAIKSVPKEEDGYFYEEKIFYMKGAILYQLITGTEPKGKVKYFESPFAIGFQITNPEDAESIKHTDKMDNIGGYYSDKTKLVGKLGWYQAVKSRIPLLELGINEVPFVYIAADEGILVKPDIPEFVTLHEVTHGINRAIVEGLMRLENDEQNQVKASYDTSELIYKLGRVKRLVESVNSNEIPPEEAFHQLKQILAGSVFTLQMDIVQDEAIANFKYTNSLNYVTTDLSYRVENGRVIEPLDSYVHYLKLLGLNYAQIRGSLFETVFLKFVQRYNQILSSNVSFLNELLRLRSKFRENKDNSDIEAFMRQNPFNEWGTRARKQFKEEYSRLKFVSDKH